MIFTQRDAEILRWINGQGFATGRQIGEWLGIHDIASVTPHTRWCV